MFLKKLATVTAFAVAAMISPAQAQQVEINDAAQRVLAAIAQRQADGPHANLDLETTALVLVEMQGEWLSPEGRLRFLAVDGGAAIDEAAEEAEEVLQAARDADMTIVHVGITFEEGHPELGDGIYGLRGIQPITNVFVEGTPGAAFDARFEPRDEELVADGRTGGSAFAGSNLEVLLRNNGIETIILAGYATDVCVESTLRQGHDLGFNVIVLEDATASFAPMFHNYVMEHSVRQWGIAVPSQSIVDQLAQVD